MKNPNLLLVGSVVFILLAVALVAILDKSSSSSNSANDVRARAATHQALALVGTVSAVDEGKGTVTVDNVLFASNTSGQNLGSWIVTAPSGFNFATVSPGMKLTIGVDATTFQVTTHTMTALTLVPAK